MARKRRVYEDDDGRTIADMSGVERPNLLGFRLPPDRAARGASTEQAETPQDRPWEKTELTSAERRAVVWGAVKAGILIALAFIVSFAALILVMTKLL